jgi:hypothetical protein
VAAVRHRNEDRDVTYYDHPAIEYIEPGETKRECSKCGVEVTGVKGVNLMHFDEQVPLITVPREYMAAVRQATAAIGQAQSQITKRASDEERARAAAVALYSAGLLRVKPVKPRVKTTR